MPRSPGHGPGFETRRQQIIDQAAVLFASDMLEAAARADRRREVDSDLAMLQYLNMHNYTYSWVRPDGPWSADELSREYRRTVLAGLGAVGLDAMEARVAQLLSDCQLSAVVDA